MSLLGPVRHLADVERSWFGALLARQDGQPSRYSSRENLDGDFDGAVPDDEVVAEAWRAGREEVAFAEQLVRDAADLGFVADAGHHGEISLREVLVHMVEECARHNGQPIACASASTARSGE